MGCTGAMSTQYIEEPAGCWEDSLTFYQETGVPVALDESLDVAMRQVSWDSCFPVL